MFEIRSCIQMISIHSVDKFQGIHTGCSS